MMRRECARATLVDVDVAAAAAFFKTLVALFCIKATSEPAAAAAAAATVAARARACSWVPGNAV